MMTVLLFLSCLVLLCITLVELRALIRAMERASIAETLEEFWRKKSDEHKATSMWHKEGGEYWRARAFRAERELEED